MERKNSKEARTRMIHVRLPETVHKEVRVRAAETDKTIQDWVVDSIKAQLEREAKGEYRIGRS